ncbi:hypothetical protein CMV30_00340 [Nibricoccus aquaticus]|uniref:Uncharacterized protein n=1 Tax=Nibricoccus aquaticus TaxID=2576891 RepID=A0A290QB61_9BACT|nr:hypothetical protein CMV30_00340 [Nibricoccus aquaticus]
MFKIALKPAPARDEIISVHEPPRSHRFPSLRPAPKRHHRLRHFLEKLRKAPLGWPVLSSLKNMSGAPFPRLQNPRRRPSFSSRPMNDFSRMEESGAANIAESFMSASSVETTAQGGRPFSR